MVGYSPSPAVGSYQHWRVAALTALAGNPHTPRTAVTETLPALHPLELAWICHQDDAPTGCKQPRRPSPCPTCSPVRHPAGTWNALRKSLDYGPTDEEITFAQLLDSIQAPSPGASVLQRTS
ncbi:hypothetical protein [Streptomyces mirabilis]|uniref:hypothetical protein n=1 Tax=Streptomyces mirabilis TaxID=68239 RepID=UPI0036EA7914